MESAEYNEYENDHEDNDKTKSHVILMVDKVDSAILAHLSTAVGPTVITTAYHGKSEAFNGRVSMRSIMM